MEKVHILIDTLLFYLLSLALGLLVAICFIQVTARYVFNSAFTWAEEVSIIILLWSTWGGACLAFKEREHLRVKILEDRLPEKTILILRLILDCLVVLFLISVVLSSRTVINAIGSQTLWSLPDVSVKVMYVSVPIGCMLMIYYQARLIIGDVKRLRVISEEAA